MYFASLNTEIGIIYQVSRTSEMNILLIESGLVCVCLCLCRHVSALQRKRKGYLYNFSIINSVVRCWQTMAINRKHNWWEDTFTFTKISGNLRWIHSKTWQTQSKTFCHRRTYGIWILYRCAHLMMILQHLMYRHLLPNAICMPSDEERER